MEVSNIEHILQFMRPYPKVTSFAMATSTTYALISYENSAVRYLYVTDIFNIRKHSTFQGVYYVNIHNTFQQGYKSYI